MLIVQTEKKTAQFTARCEVEGDDVVVEYAEPDGSWVRLRLSGLVEALVAHGVVQRPKEPKGRAPSFGQAPARPLAGVTAEEALLLLYAPYERPLLISEGEVAAVSRLTQAGLADQDPTAASRVRATERGEEVRDALLAGLRPFLKLVAADLGLDVRRFLGGVSSVATRLEPRV